MNQQDVILHVEHMTKSFGDLKVLNDVSFDMCIEENFSVLSARLAAAKPPF